MEAAPQVVEGTLIDEFPAKPRQEVATRMYSPAMIEVIFNDLPLLILHLQKVVQGIVAIPHATELGFNCVGLTFVCIVGSTIKQIILTAGRQSDDDLEIGQGIFASISDAAIVDPEVAGEQ